MATAVLTASAGVHPCRACQSGAPFHGVTSHARFAAGIAAGELCAPGNQMVLDGGCIIFHDGMYVLCVFFPGKWEDEGKEKGSVTVER